MSNNITALRALVLRNSRGTETISVTVEAGGYVGTFALPDGASTGSREVHVKSPSEACKIVEEIVAPALVGLDVTQQDHIDAKLHELDSSALLDGIGGNVALGASIASCKASASLQGVPTWRYVQTLFTQPSQSLAPRLFVNLINGGKHATYGSPIQEHQIIPDTDDVAHAYEVACDVQHVLNILLVEKYGEANIGKGDEGGFMIPSVSVFEPFQLLAQAIEKAAPSIPVHIGTDIAASSFYEEGRYMLEDESKNSLELLDFYDELHKRVPLLHMVEDPFFESDLETYAQYKKEHQDVLVIGDDLTTTNVKSLQAAVEAEAISGIIIKPNQIGTLTDTLTTMTYAYVHGVSSIVSHRSGETTDDFIADLAFGTGAYGLKAGAPHAKEREAKYQRLIHIQKTLHD